MTFRTIYSFQGSRAGDGAHPAAGLIDVNGLLYGTTSSGGAKDMGTVFSVTPSGTENNLHSFGRGSDGADPLAGLLNVNGTLYGTTSGGGAGLVGTVFTITTYGTENVLYSFTGLSTDGAHPSANVIDVKGTFYSTTDAGGKTNHGTIFRVMSSGKEAVLHTFAGSPGDGQGPSGGLLSDNDALYGMTANGGATGDGTVFKIAPSGSESLLYSFKGAPDGGYPQGRLIDVNGILYGITPGGGNAVNGTVFKITTSGNESVLYSFQGDSDGSEPLGYLTNVKASGLYGTTASAGAYNHGTIYMITTSGTKTVLYNFTGGIDGGTPYAGLLQVNGTLYGTTFYGGKTGNGTIFSLTL